MQTYGRPFSAKTSLQKADEALYATKNADYGAIDFQPPTGGGDGHMMNWFNLNDNIVYIDFKTGEMFTAQTLAPTYGSWSARYVNLTL